MKKIYKLTILLLVLVIFPFFTSYCKSPQENKQFDTYSLGIDFESFNKRYHENKRLQIIDARTLEEHKIGHIPGALLLPVQDLESSKDPGNILSTLKRDEEIYIYCSAGGPRSQKAAVILRDMGFKKAFFVEGGIAQWIATGSPIQED